MKITYEIYLATAYDNPACESRNLFKIVKEKSTIPIDQKIAPKLLQRNTEFKF